MASTTTTQTSAVPADDNVGWEDFKGDNGVDYRIKASDYNIGDKSDAEANEVNASGPSFDVNVNWSFGKEGSPPEDIQDKTAITWFKLSSAPWYSPYKYQLTINCKDTYNYHFYDETNDSYQLNVWQSAGTHTVQYRSDRPTIVRITGS